jgi:hypothetical protein
MFERFAEGSRREIALASQEAKELGHDFIGTEHLLLGLLAAGEGTAVAVLTDLDVTLDDARRKVAQRVHASGSGSIDSPPFTPLAKRVLERALRETMRLNAKSVESEHLLLGLIEVPDGGGARILAELAGSLEQVRQGVQARIGPPPAPPGAGRATAAGAPLEQTKAPLTGGALRRWATQTRVVFRSPAEEAGENADTVATKDAAAPRCGSCQASLVTEARYRMINVAPDLGPDRPAVESAADSDASTETDTDADTGGRPATATRPATDAALAPADPVTLGDLTVNVVFCRNCGVALGIA